MKLQDLQVLAQLEDNLAIIVAKLEQAYKEKNPEIFQRAKEEIIGTKEKISFILK